MIYNRIEKIGIIPVITLNDPSHAVSTANALNKGGIPAAEITFRTQAAAEGIRAISSELPEMLLGAGTVLKIEQAIQAVEAGAAFIVTPGFNPKVVDYCLKNDIPIIPGVSGASDIEQALDRGLKAVKIFPAEIIGGCALLKAYASVYGDMKFLPTGGIHSENIASYLKLKNVLACGGSWMAPSTLIDMGKFENITATTKQAVLASLGFELMHIGINESSREKALETAQFFSSIFGFPLNEKKSSFFSSDRLEILKQGGTGTYGHIAIGVNRLSMAKRYLEELGVTFDHSTETRKAIYLSDMISGFSVHLLEK